MKWDQAMEFANAVSMESEWEHNCLTLVTGEGEWRWLECAECKEAGVTCEMKICVDCGAEVGED